MRVIEELQFRGTIFCVDWVMCLLNLWTDIETAIERELRARLCKECEWENEFECVWECDCKSVCVGQEG